MLGRYLDFGIDSIPSTIPKSIDSIPSTRQTALIVLYANNSSCRPNSNETRMPYFKAEIFQRNKTKREWFCVQNENKNEKVVITLEKMVDISLDFSFFPLKFPPFLGIDHLENVSMRYRYPKVLGYRVLGIDIDQALVQGQRLDSRLHTTNEAHAWRWGSQNLDVWRSDIP